MFDKLGGRKFVAATLTVAVGILVTFFKGDVPDNLTNLLEVVFGIFAGGNVVATVAGTVRGAKAPAGEEASEAVAQPVDLPPSNGEGSEPPTPQASASPAAGITNEQIYQGMAEIYQKVQAVETALGEVVKSSGVSQKVLNVLLERSGS